MDKSREDFEAWCADEMGNTFGFIKDMRRRDIHGIDCYGREEINKRWRAWQASRQALVLEACDFDTFSPYDCGDDAVWMTEVIKTLRKYGITVKGEGDEQTSVLSD